ncbi:hypothetical protein RUM44_009172 [Polyplax serrata]|uniref:Uncharacterized protein n=1 Tax=Polyplax serrata TaxID=468196 RepID=A0ABR1ARZ4_POLSC
MSSVPQGAFASFKVKQNLKKIKFGNADEESQSNTIQRSAWMVGLACHPKSSRFSVDQIKRSKPNTSKDNSTGCLSVTGTTTFCLPHPLNS